MQNNSDNSCDSNGSFEHRYKTLLAALDSCESSFVIDQDGTILEANKAFAAIFGKEVHELINRNAFDLLSPELAASRREKVEVAFHTARHIIFEDERDGNCIRNTIYPIPDSNGTITQLYITGQDITELKRAEKEMTTLQIFNSALVESIPGGFYVLDAEGRFVKWNVYERDVIIGKTDSAMRNSFALESIHPDDRPVIAEKILNVLKNGEEDSAEIKVLLHGGPEFRWHQVSGKRMIINDIPFIIGIATDITAKKLAEEALLKNSREQLRELFEGHSSIMVVVDNKGNIIEANPSAAMFYGWPIEKLCTINVEEITLNPPELVLAEREQIMTSKQNRFSVSHRRADGSIRDVELLVLNKPENEGKALFYCIINDITEQKQQDDALKKSEERFRTLFENHSAVMILLDPDTGNIMDVNHAAANFYGWSRETLRKMRIQQITNVTPEEVKANPEKSKLTQQSIFLVRHKRADGSVRDVEIFSTPVEIDGKSILYAIIHDITERKQAAEESDRLKSAFLANINHEIRTPMNGILGFSELLKDPHLTGEEKGEYIALIHQSGQRMLDLINDLMDISKIDAKEAKPVESETSVNHLLHDLLAFSSLEANKKELRLSCTKGLPDNESIITTDSGKLIQILTNLIQNALKFTLKGGIDFGYSKKKNMLEFFVIDSGIGIPDGKKEKIFERFHQVDNSLTRAHEGSGLGLSITKAFVEMLGGTIHVESVEGAGTTVSFTLPYKPVNIAVSSSDTNQDSADSAPALTILIVEDDDLSTILLKKNLKDENSTILCAENGWEAVELVQHHPEINLVLMDIKMSVMNGFEATRLIKELRPDLPVIIQSAFTSKEDREKARETGCDSFITKPISKSELLELLHGLLK